MSRKRSGNIIALFLLTITLVYGLYQGRALIDGPKLTVSSPAPGETITDTLYLIRGTTENAAHIEINGKQITMDTAGNFSETFVTPEGYGVVLVEAKDRFGNKTKEYVKFYGKPQNT